MQGDPQGVSKLCQSTQGEGGRGGAGAYDQKEEMWTKPERDKSAS